jgi:hypothetical protein
MQWDFKAVAQRVTPTQFIEETLRVNNSPSGGGGTEISPLGSSSLSLLHVSKKGDG